MFVSDFMTRNLVTAQADEKAGQALQRMREQGLRRLPVLDAGGNLVGIVSDRRLLRALSVPVRRGQMRRQVVQPPALTVGAIMNPAPYTTTPDTPLEVAAAQMTGRRVGSLVVMDGGRPVGIITETDLFRIFLRLLMGDQEGLRVTVRAPAFRGILADIANDIARSGGNLLSLGTLTEGDEYLVSFRVADLTREQLEDLLVELPVETVDIR